MMRLSNPSYTFPQTVEACIEGITGLPVLLEKVNTSKPDLLLVEASYMQAAAVGWHSVDPLDTSITPDPFVVNTLTKSDLKKIYTQYFVPESKPAREIYDALLNAASGNCPFCGGIGTPKNLDHFLPKDSFPQFSILLLNLVPSCRDCNMGEKGEIFATTEAEQFIHPYLENNKFFQEQWIYATYHVGNPGHPGKYEYVVSPPNTWSPEEQHRVIKHFKDFDISNRYSKQAAVPLKTLLDQIQNLQNHGLSNALIKTTMLQAGVDKAPFANHWQTGMYQAMISFLP